MQKHIDFIEDLLEGILRLVHRVDGTDVRNERWDLILADIHLDRQDGVLEGVLGFSVSGHTVELFLTIIII